MGGQCFRRNVAESLPRSGRAARAAAPARGDNGGATSDGVSETEVKIIYFESQPNEQVNAILGVKGLATSSEQEDAAIAAYTEFTTSHYELYGRKLVFEKVIGDCPTTPPDYQKCEVAAQEVVKKHPFMVIWITPLYADVFDIWANAGIVSIGGAQGTDRKS